MNLVRHQLGFSEQEQRFPAKATCLAIYSKAINSGHCEQLHLLAAARSGKALQQGIGEKPMIAVIMELT